MLLVGVLYLASQRLVMLGDVVVLILCALFMVPLCWVLFWRARVRRQAFRDFYLAPDSRWHRWIRGGVVMLTSRLILAAVLALLLLIGLARAESQLFWATLLAVGLMWPFSYRIILSQVARQASARFQRLLATRLHLIAWFMLLLALLLLPEFLVPVPDVRGLSLDEAVLRFTLAYSAESQTLDWGLLATEGVRALPHWLVQNLTAGWPGKAFAALAWSMVLVREWLFVWPILLLFQAMHDMLDGGITRRMHEAGLEWKV